MHRIVSLSVFAIVLTLWLPAGPASAQTRPATPPVAVPSGDEIKLDESSALKASAIQSRMSAILANFALLQRQAQDLQTEMTKSLDDRKKLLDEAGRKVRAEVRDPNEWVYDEAGQRYIRARKTP
jgi:hypothetical protein